MRAMVFAGMAGFALVLSACQNEPEETPDITEAIPLDPEPSDGEGALNPPGSGDDGSTNPPSDDASERPDTMERGANPPGYTPPPGSKIQPAG